MITFAWMTNWLFQNKKEIPLPAYTLGSVGLAIITLMNIILLYRLLKSDFFRTPTIATENKVD